MCMIEVKRTEQIWIKPNKEISKLCHISKNLYNQANYIIRQELDSNNRWIRAYELMQILRYIKDHNNYIKLPAATSQQILKLLDKSWLSFFRSIKDWKKYPYKYKERPRPLRYKKKDGEHILVFTASSQIRFKDNLMKLPERVNLEIKTRLNDDTDIREVRIIPKGVGYTLEIVYNKNIETKEVDHDRIAGIDLGCKNIITMVNNIGEVPIIVKDDGYGVKSTNQFYAKKRSELQSIYDKQRIKQGDKLNRLINKWSKKSNDYIHKLSRFIVDYCVKHKIGRLVVGYNKGWKDRVNLGRRTNQTFVQIPFEKLIKQIEYKVEEESIEVVRHEEKHTSKCSFLDDEPVEHREKYVGKRFKRGLFRSQMGTVINSDVNAGYNIIRKAIPGGIPLRISEWIGGCGLHPIRCKVSS